MNRRYCAIVLVTLAATSAAPAQSESALRELAALHAKLARPERVITQAEAEAAAAKLDAWKLDTARLKAKSRDAFLELRVYVALGRGDVAAGRAAFESLQKEHPDDPRTHSAAYLVACAAGDAQAGQAAIATLRSGEDRSLWSRRLRWIKHVGDFAPPLRIQCENAAAYSTSRREGKVLVLDLWRASRRPDAAHAAAFHALYDALHASAPVEFVGVNFDSAAGEKRARTFARENGYVWPQHYEKSSTKAPIARLSFDAARPPWTVLIDAGGSVRAVGSASEPGFQYALRAALAEAAGRFEPIHPRTSDGRRPGLVPKRTASKTPAPIDPGDLPHNTQAEVLLQRARLYMKTGKRRDAKKLLQQVVSKYPGTREAYDAQEWLDNLP